MSAAIRMALSGSRRRPSTSSRRRNSSAFRPSSGTSVVKTEAQKEEERRLRQLRSEEAKEEKEAGIKRKIEKQHEEMATLRNSGWFLFGLNGNKIHEESLNYLGKLLKKQNGVLNPAFEAFYEHAEKLQSLTIEQVGDLPVNQYLPLEDNYSYNHVKYSGHDNQHEADLIAAKLKEIPGLFNSQKQILKDEIVNIQQNRTEIERQLSAKILKYTPPAQFEPSSPSSPSSHSPSRKRGRRGGGSKKRQRKQKRGTRKH